ncbi:hypothetical protein VTJ83DRAFT_5378 [Remersonia thermophila]|uniref:Methyltransferase n=1 Tax=Remersonia thermophila TaxID=72144 RepID=A0ABR4D6R8_9PEZI
MHYLRLCRPPEIHPGRDQPILKLVLTITTDLSDSFLSPPSPIPLHILGAYNETDANGNKALVPVPLTPSPPPVWRAGMRVLKLHLPLPPSTNPKKPRVLETIQIRPADIGLTALSTSDILPGNRGLIMPVYADMPRPGGPGASATPQTCFRSLRIEPCLRPAATGPQQRPQPPALLQIEEDLGESIARHIWDSGVVMASLLTDLCLGGGGGGGGGHGPRGLPLFHDLLVTPPDRRHDGRGRGLNILELGCGVGVVGISLAKILSLRQTTTTTAAAAAATVAVAAGGSPHILITDLPEAEEKAQTNIARQQRGHHAGNAPAPEPASLDFEPLDWTDGQRGVFGPKAGARAWDLAVVCDCTYNTDTIPSLVGTLSAVHRMSAEKSAPGDEAAPEEALAAGAVPAAVDTAVLVATKRRHESERSFFDLMAGEGWVVKESTEVPLPRLGGERQVVEVYLFRKQR